MAEHLALLSKREAELEGIVSGDARLIAAAAGDRYSAELESVRLVARGFRELLPAAWHVRPGDPPRHDVNRVAEARALVRARATAAVIAMTLQQRDRERRDDDQDRLQVATALFRYLRDVLEVVVTTDSSMGEDQKAALYKIAAIAGSPGFSGAGIGF